MSSLVDFYPTSLYNSYLALNGTKLAAAQGFAGTGQPVTSVKFYLKKAANPTADMYAKIYAHTGVFGNSGVPTGSPLATSNAIASSTLTTSYQLIEFIFSTPFTPTIGTCYCVSLECTVDATNQVHVAMSISGAIHTANASYLQSSTWSAYATYDLVFYLYTSAEPDIYYLTDTDISAGYTEQMATTAPSTADLFQGWKVAKLTGVGDFYHPDSEFTPSAVTSEPSGSSPALSAYAYRIPSTITKTYPAGDWMLVWRIKCNTYYAQKGKIYARLSKGTGNPQDSTPITNWVGTPEIAFTAANQFQAGTLIFSSVAEQALSSEYLFLEIIWWCTVSGGSNSAIVDWINNTGSIELFTSYSSAGGTKIFAGIAQLTSVTPIAALAVTRPLAGSADLTSYTPDAVLGLIKLFAGLASLLSTTPDADLVKLIGLAGTAQLTSVTPAAVLSVFRVLAGAATLTSITPDVLLAVIRVLAGLATLTSVTPNDIELTFEGMLRIFAGTAALQTVTPDVILAVIRAMSGVASLESVTPAVTLAITRALSGIASLQTVTPDSVLSVIRTLAGTVAIQSMTPDTILSIIRALAGTAAITSVTPDAALSVFRALSGTAQLSSLTPDNIDLSIAGLIILAGVAAMQSNTPDAALAVTRCLSGLSSLVSNTPNDVDLNLGEEIVASILRLIRRRTC